MNVALISPPSATPFAPPMSLLALRAYLERDGIDVTPIDANVEAIHYVLKPDRCRAFVEPALPILRQGLPEQVIQGLAPRRVTDERHPELPPFDEARALHVLDRLDGLWAEDGFVLSREGYPEQVSILNDAMLLASLKMFPHCLSLWGLNPGLMLTQSGQENPFLHYCMDSLLPRLTAMAPDVIGLSLGHGDQLFYTMFLVNALRRAGLARAIVVGGAYFTSLCKVPVPTDGDEMVLAGSPAAADGMIQSLVKVFGPTPGGRTDGPGPVVIGVRAEGELPLLEICRRVEARQPVADVPGAVYVDPERNAVVFNRIADPIPGEQLPGVSLAGLGIGKRYPTPLPMAVMMTSRGCYLDQCTFCDHARILGPGFREVPPATVADTLEAFRDAGVEYVFMCDESLSPRMLRELTAELARRDVFIRYGTMCRVESEFIPLIASAAAQGLSFMSFGFESACDRITGCMNKGYTRADAEALLEECCQHGVSVQYFTMFGFPSETRAEAQETIDYLDRLGDKIWGISVAPWTLTAGSYVNDHLDEFGVTPMGEGKAMKDPSTFSLAEGLSATEAAEFIHRLKTHPRLERFFRVQAVEDYRIIVDLLAGELAEADKTGSDTP
jgi:anaerobic magnesium-protoporphyrin IX monomethyl ester cyclase